MEQNNFTAKILKRLTIYSALALLLYGALAGFYNPWTHALTARENKPLNILILTAPPMFVSYNPAAGEALVTNIRLDKKNLTAADILKEAGISPAEVVYLAPSTKPRAAFWEDVKTNMLAWHHKPYIILDYIYRYAKLRVTRRTNIAPSDFIMISLELMRLKPADFTVSNPDEPPKPKTRAPQPPQPAQIMVAKNTPARQPEKPKTLVVEILNASGSAGLAAEVTRYLRGLSNSGVLDVDVINYANYPAVEQNTKLIDMSDRQEDLKKIGHYLGLSSREIFTASDKAAISDAKIILGKDFVMPKNKQKMID